DPESEGGGPLVCPGPIGDPEELDLRESLQAIEEPGREVALVRGDRTERRDQGGTARAGFGRAVGGADAREIVDGGDEPGEALMALGAGLPTVWGLVARGTNLVRGPGLEEPATHGEGAEVRAEQLVGRAREDVRV